MENESVISTEPTKEDGGESIDEMLDNIDNFIEGVYRDLSMSPPKRSSALNSAKLCTNLTEDDSSSSSASSCSPAVPSSPSASTLRKNIPPRSPRARRNMESEIERLDQIRNSIEKNLSSIGIFINSTPGRSSENMSNTIVTTTPSSSTSIIIVNNSNPSSTIINRRRSSRTRQVAGQFVDLSNSVTETSEIRRPPASDNSDEDDDVILVSAEFPPVIDLCTPARYTGTRTRSMSSFNGQRTSRRRLPDQNDTSDGCCGGPSPPRRLREDLSCTSPANDRFSNGNTSPPSSDTGRSQFICAVCMESYLQREPTSTICGHIFCKQCIARSIRFTHKCPMCNKKINRNQTFRIYH